MSGRAILRILVIVSTMCTQLPAQTQPEAAKPTAFEVASVRPNPAGGDDSEVRTLPGGRFTAVDVTLRMLIQAAFRVKDFQITGGPRWLGTARYDVAARAEYPGKIGDDELKPLLQGMLADRFALKVHHETRELPVYSLVVGKGGPKLAVNTGTKGYSQRISMASGRVSITATKVPIADLVSNLGRQLGRTVIDNTGLKGEFDFQLEWSAEETAESSAPSISTALQEQLGLRLEATKGAVDVIVVDSADWPSEN